MFSEMVNTPLMDSLGWTVVHSVWQGAIIALLLCIAFYFVGKKQSLVRYWLAVLSLLFMLVWSGVTFMSHYIEASDRCDTTYTCEAVKETSPPPFYEVEGYMEERIRVAKEELAPTMSYVDFQDTIQEYLPWIVWLWGIGVAFFFLRWLGGALYLQRIKLLYTHPVAEEWDELLENLREKLGIRRGVELLSSMRVHSPMVIGHLKPVILVPIGLLTHLTPAQVEAMLAHELAHIKRYDFLINLLQSWVEILFFYHPAYWWIAAQVQNERENSCDDMAVSVCGSKWEYVNTLAVLAEMRLQTPQLAMGFAGNKQNLLLNRIKRIMTPNENSKQFGGRILASSLLVLLLFGFVLWSPSHASISKKAKAWLEIPVELLEEAGEKIEEVFASTASNETESDDDDDQGDDNPAGSIPKSPNPVESTPEEPAPPPFPGIEEGNDWEQKNNFSNGNNTFRFSFNDSTFEFSELEELNKMFGDSSFFHFDNSGKNLSIFFDKDDQGNMNFRWDENGELQRFWAPGKDLTLEWTGEGKNFFFDYDSDDNAFFFKNDNGKNLFFNGESLEKLIEDATDTEDLFDMSDMNAFLGNLNVHIEGMDLLDDRKKERLERQLEQAQRRLEEQMRRKDERMRDVEEKMRELELQKEERLRELHERLAEEEEERNERLRQMNERLAEEEEERNERMEELAERLEEKFDRNHDVGTDWENFREALSDEMEQDDLRNYNKKKTNISYNNGKLSINGNNLEGRLKEKYIDFLKQHGINFSEGSMMQLTF